MTWSFGKDGKNARMNRTTQEAAYRAASNAWMTLMAGFTTVQSVGSPADVPLRDAIAQGGLPGPRILTAIQGLQGCGAQTGTPDEIRDFVRKQKQATAALIKIFASGGMLQGEMTLSQEQLNAADEYKLPLVDPAVARVWLPSPSSLFRFCCSWAWRPVWPRCPYSARSW